LLDGILSVLSSTDETSLCSRAGVPSVWRFVAGIRRLLVTLLCSAAQSARQRWLSVKPTDRFEIDKGVSPRRDGDLEFVLAHAFAHATIIGVRLIVSRT
jgi:hypothetical protein